MAKTFSLDKNSFDESFEDDDELSEVDFEKDDVEEGEIF